jgi:hypothetical protein
MLSLPYKPILFLKLFFLLQNDLPDAMVFPQADMTLFLQKIQ